MIGWVLPVPQMIKLPNFQLSAFNSVAVSGLGIGFQVILKKWSTVHTLAIKSN